MKTKIMFLTVVLAAAVQSSPASAQTVENAYAFFDQVIMNGATTLKTGEHNSFEKPAINPNASISSSCKSVIKLPNGDAQPTAYTIDWVKSVEVAGFFEDKTKPGLKLIGGVSEIEYWRYGDIRYSGPRPALIIMTGALSMDERLTKAMKMIIDTCADKSTGF